MILEHMQAHHDHLPHVVQQHHEHHVLLLRYKLVVDRANNTWCLAEDYTGGGAKSSTSDAHVGSLKA
jgi:hypothetical protein